MGQPVGPDLGATPEGEFWVVSQSLVSLSQGAAGSTSLTNAAQMPIGTIFWEEIATC
jgi:hypothetical protein